MLCKKPFMRGLIPCQCGQCMPCRIQKRRMWANRLMLEKSSSSAACFVTLTYRDEEVHDVSGPKWIADRPVLGDLRKEDVQKWLKRLRKSCATPIRFFLVGEYGEITQRPHYHAAIFGLPPCSYGRTRTGVKICCESCELVRKSWPVGHSYVGELTDKSANYIAGYVTKKWTKEDSWTKEKLKGRQPEFVRMSLKPGIGAIAIKNLVTSGVRSRQGKFVKRCLDAPAVLRNSGRTLPLGKYLRRKWREALGRSPDTPEFVIQEYVNRMQELYKESVALAKKEGVPKAFSDPSAIYFKENRQRIRNLEARVKIFANRGVI